MERHYKKKYLKFLPIRVCKGNIIGRTLEVPFSLKISTRILSASTGDGL